MDKAFLYVIDNPDKIRQFVNLHSGKGNLTFFTNTGNATTQTKGMEYTMHSRSWDEERV